MLDKLTTMILLKLTYYALFFQTAFKITTFKQNGQLGEAADNSSP